MASETVFTAAATAPPADQPAMLRRAQDLAELGALADAYRFLQQATGVLAVTLPFVLALGDFIAGGTELRGSISSYYYTHLGNWFVGTLFALGVFFLSYNFRPLPGYRLDNYLSDAAALCAVGVALFPTAEDAVHASTASHIVSTIHLAFASTLFVLLAVFALFRFTLTNAGSASATTTEKRRRNLVYRVCGSVITIAIVLVLVAQVAHPPRSWHSVFWLESVAVVAFGVSWLVKGGFLGVLADP